MMSRHKQVSCYTIVLEPHGTAMQLYTHATSLMLQALHLFHSEFQTIRKLK